MQLVTQTYLYMVVIITSVNYIYTEQCETECVPVLRKLTAVLPVHGSEKVGNH
jgi:hypothetical protein